MSIVSNTAAAVPHLTIDGHTATITGVRFQHRSQCIRCRHTVHLTSEGGQIDLGLQVSKSGKTVCWYLRHTARAVEVPDRCPRCGNDRWSLQIQGGSPFNHPNHVLPATQQGYLALQNEAYTAFRAQYPQLAAKADERTSHRQVTVKSAAPHRHWHRAGAPYQVADGMYFQVNRCDCGDTFTSLAK